MSYVDSLLVFIQTNLQSFIVGLQCSIGISLLHQLLFQVGHTTSQLRRRLIISLIKLRPLTTRLTATSFYASSFQRKLYVTTLLAQLNMAVLTANFQANQS